MNRQIPNLTPKGHLHHLLQFAAILGADAPIRPTRNRHAQLSLTKIPYSLPHLLFPESNRKAGGVCDLAE